MNLERMLTVAMGNKVVMKFIASKAESLIRSKMQGATHIQIEVKDGQTTIKAAIFEDHDVLLKKAWLIDPKKALSMGGGFDLVKLISFIKVQGRPLDLSAIPDVLILVQDVKGEPMQITASMPDGRIVTTGTVVELLKLAAGNIGSVEIEEGATEMLKDGEGLAVLPETVEEITEQIENEGVED